MSDQGLNLHPPGPARLRYGSRRDRDFGMVYRYRKHIVVALLVFGDLAAALTAIWCTNSLMRMSGMSPPETRQIAILLVILAFFVVGLYTGRGPGPYERFRQRAIGVAGFVAVWTLDTMPGRNVSDFMIVPFANALCLLLISHYIEAVTRALLMRIDVWGAPTILVGAPDRCSKLAQLLACKPELGLKPVALISNADAGSPGGGSFPVPLVGTTADFSRIRPGTPIELAIFMNASDLTAVPRDCPVFAAPCRFMLLQDIHNVQAPWVRTRTLETMIGVEVRRGLWSQQNRLLKRILDLVIAVPVALLASPVIALAAACIKLIDPGPAFYVQNRIGFNGKIVAVLKLRTMYADSERLLEEYLQRDLQARAEWQKFFKLRHDPRILPIIGSFLRRSSADELPQLWNVISGDMSLVGPRPLPSYHAQQLDQEFQSLRTRVLPGITGLWQVSSRSDGDLQALRQQDLFYIRNWSPWLDVFILLQTIPAVLTAKGAR